MKVSEFEKKVGVSRDTLRYYEKLGLLTAPKRGLNGYRFYSQIQIEELKFIQQGKLIGFSLQDIKLGYSRFKELGHMCPEFKKQLLEKKQTFQRRIKEDQRAILQIDKILK